MGLRPATPRWLFSQPVDVQATLDDILRVPAESRMDLWGRFIDSMDVRHMAEIGVLDGKFAASTLQRCARIERYYMIDPWRHLDDWNKPANGSDEAFERNRECALESTAAWEGKRVVLRGKTTEVIDRIPDRSLDFAYIDGDHTLRGIAIDLINAYGKVREGGAIAGDDFSPTIWQHPSHFEPTLVFPFAVHFAEAMAEPVYALPDNQFLIEVGSDRGFEFRDSTGQYDRLELRSHVEPRPQAG